MNGLSPLHVDFRFVELEHELDSLSTFREVFEEQLNFVEDQQRIRLNARFASAEWDDADRQVASQEVDFLVEEVLPRFFRGPFLISLWAVFESGMIELADYLAEKKQLPLKLRDIRGCNPFDQWNKYYTHVAGYSLGFDESTRQKLEELRLVRNALAHANGRIDLVKQRDREKLEMWCAEDRGLHTRFHLLIFSVEYTREAEVLVTEALSGLLSRVRSDFPA